MQAQNMNVDALVIGGGIAGLQAALDLADQDFTVLIVEREPSIGGKMIALSKVFPTLDCSSCICTPRMAAAAHHENITIMTYAELEKIKRSNSGFTASVLKKPRYVKEEDCTGCRLCEYACPMELPDEFEGNLGMRKAIYVPFSNAIPQVALLDVDHCLLCGRCEKACPTDAVDFLQEPERITVEAGTIILATGFQLTPMEAKAEYGQGRLHNVLSALQVERLLAPHGPYGRVLRPSDGKVPDTVAYVQCAGSRDQSLGVPYCSRVCCMYAIKQAMLLAGALPLVEVTIYYMDIRAFGKGFEQFYQNAKAMGIEFVRAKVGKITEDQDQNPIVRIEVTDEDGRVEERVHDMVVLSLGMLPAAGGNGFLPVDPHDGFIRCPQPKLAPCRTEEEGVFVAGTAAGPKDIPDSIVEAGAAAVEAAIYLRRSGRQPRETRRSADLPDHALAAAGPGGTDSQ
jgi:heterodisulfide reductase subunit A